jgi:hypothetical protein
MRVVDGDIFAHINALVLSFVLCDAHGLHISLIHRDGVPFGLALWFAE